MLAILLYAFVAVILIQSFFYLYFFRRFAIAKPKSLNGSLPATSLILYIKNEEEFLKRNLPLFLEQDHPDFEIILINYDSSDKSKDVIEAFAETNSKIRLVNVKNNEHFWGQKKYALTLGIKAAKNPNLVFTRIDCNPNSVSWLSKLSSHFNSGQTIILGHSCYKKANKSLLNGFMRFENLFSAMENFSYTLAGFPYKGSGKNLAYHSNEFYSVKGFVNHMNIAYGEAELFVNEASTDKNTAICIDEDTFTATDIPRSFSLWYTQKKEEFFLSRSYKTINKVFNTVFSVSQFLFWILTVILLVLQLNIWLVMSLILLRWIIVYAIYIPVAKKLKEKQLLFLLPIYDLFLVIFQFTIFINNIKSKPANWR